jgi:STE24 endopeptidase
MSDVLLAMIVVLVGLALLVAIARIQVPRVATPVVDAAAIDRDFSAAEQRREQAFHRRVRPWSLLSVALGVLVPTALVVSGTLARVAAASGSWWVGVVAVVTLTLAVTRLVTLPPSMIVRRCSLEVGLASGTWARWARDLVVAFLVGWLVSMLGLLGWMAAVRAWPSGWWLVVAPTAAGLTVLVSFVVPVVVEPLFARFTPLPDGPLRVRLLGLADADGVVVREVLVADASRRTSALNAYVSGLGATRRVVVHDTLVDRGRDDEVASVVAHELGHVVAHDVRTATVLGAGAVMVAVAASSVVWPVLEGLSHSASADDAALTGALIAAGAWVSLLAAPVQNAVSRNVERSADVHALELTGDPGSVAVMHRSLSVVNLASLRPPRLLHLWFGSHPTSPERIAAAREWARQHGQAEPGDLLLDDTGVQE